MLVWISRLQKADLLVNEHRHLAELIVEKLC
jgi:hypothetical protein